MWYFAFTHDMKTMVYVPVINLLSLSSKPTLHCFCKKEDGPLKDFFPFDNRYDAEFCQWKALCWRDLSGGRPGLLRRRSCSVDRSLAVQARLLQCSRLLRHLVLCRQLLQRLAPVTHSGQQPSQIIPWGGSVVVPMVRHFPADKLCLASQRVTSQQVLPVNIIALSLPPSGPRSATRFRLQPWECSSLNSQPQGWWLLFISAIPILFGLLSKQSLITPILLQLINLY